MVKLQQREQTNVLKSDANVTVCQGQAETLSSAEQGYWCRHLWHGCTCNHQHNSLHPGAVLALHKCMLQRFGSPDLVNCNALVQDVMTVAHQQLRVLLHIALKLPLPLRR